MEDNNRKALIVAYYLSRFDRVALRNLGYKTFNLAFNEIGRIFSVNPNSIKNMRDEFDPLHDNPRRGWYQRGLRPSRVEVVQKLQEKDEEDIREFVIGLMRNYKDELEVFNTLITSNDNVESSRDFYVLRGPTGKAAEIFFQEIYTKNFIVLDNRLPDGFLKDTRDLCCGYDFEITCGNDKYFVEVKGLAEETGGILFTNKEWEVAKQKRQKYFLVIVKNISSEPYCSIVCDPYAAFAARKNITTTIQVSWSISANQVANI